MNKLTPPQSADVIKYYDHANNGEAREKGWKDKVSLARTALQTTTPGHSILPDKTPLLTGEEMEEGLEYIKNPPISPELEAKIDRLVETGQFSYDDARRRVLGK